MNEVDLLNSLNYHEVIDYIQNGYVLPNLNNYPIKGQISHIEKNNAVIEIGTKKVIFMTAQTARLIIRDLPNLTLSLREVNKYGYNVLEPFENYKIEFINGRLQAIAK